MAAKIHIYGQIASPYAEWTQLLGEATPAGRRTDAILSGKNKINEAPLLIFYV
jgi:hypothetical protein